MNGIDNTGRCCRDCVSITYDVLAPSGYGRFTCRYGRRVVCSGRGGLHSRPVAVFVRFSLDAHFHFKYTIAVPRSFS
jgi:hypothetical protein